MLRNQRIQALFKISVFMIVCMLPWLAMAQTGCPGPDQSACPIDGGLSILLAAGVGYGVKKYRDGKKRLEVE